MKKLIKIPLTNHFNLDPETFIGEITLYKEIPPNTIITFGYEVLEQENKTPKKIRIFEAAVIPQQHFKNYLDALPDSCIQSGGHVRGKGKRCQICSAQMA